MGARQARNLQREGYSLVVYDRSISKLEEYSERGVVEVASSPAAVAETEGKSSNDVLLSMPMHSLYFLYSTNEYSIGKPNQVRCPMQVCRCSSPCSQRASRPGKSTVETRASSLLKVGPRPRPVR